MITIFQVYDFSIPIKFCQIGTREGNGWQLVWHDIDPYRAVLGHIDIGRARGRGRMRETKRERDEERERA